MNLLELFAGSRSIWKVWEELWMQVFSSDYRGFEWIKYVVDILDFDVLKVPFVPDIIWASPPCTFFSVASIWHHWNKDNTPKTSNAMLWVKYVEKTIQIINYFLEKNENLKWYIENPTWKLRKLPIVNGKFDCVTITYCKYWDIRMKPTDIWTNNLYSPLFNPKWWNPRERDVIHEIYATMNLHQDEVKQGLND